MNEQDDFLRAIRDDPENDTLRLVYADWLQENQEGEICEVCDGLRCHRSKKNPFEWEDCKACSGTGGNSNSFEARATAIRLSIKLDQMSRCGKTKWQCRKCSRCEAFEQTSCNLDKVLPRVELGVAGTTDGFLERENWLNASFSSLHFRHGFVEGVSLVFAALVMYYDEIVNHPGVVLREVKLISDSIRSRAYNATLNQFEIGWSDGVQTVVPNRWCTSVPDSFQFARAIQLARQKRFPGHCPNHPIKWIFPQEVEDE